ncbi:MAG: hypothetical protein M3384_10325 [Acidobacteriota bacterium]|nr:hypothetical protein [Acidobacteriota bacterium]
MKIFEGKTPSERKKLIAAMVLGALAVLTLVYNFSGTFFGGRKTTVNVSVSPTPSATLSAGGGNSAPRQSDIQLLSQDQIMRDWLTTPVVYAPGSFYAPDAGRNIFAFYEPPEPTPYVEIPASIKTPPPTPPPTPAPTPPILLSYASPQSVYAGSKGFRLEVSGDKFTPDSLIFWNGSQLPTNFVSPQKLAADIPAGMIAGEGQRSIEIRTPDGKLYSNPVILTVQAPPRPTVQYIGVEMARRGNNNTAYFREPGNPIEFGRRLSDIVNPNSVNNRFRVVSISVNEVILEDTGLGFRHKLPMARTGAGGAGGGQTTPSRGGFERTNPGGRFPGENPTVVPAPYNPTMPQTQEIPGIPNNIPRYVPPTPQQQKKDEDDEDGDN